MHSYYYSLMPIWLIHNNTLIISSSQVLVEINTTGTFLVIRVERDVLSIAYLRAKAPI